MPLPSGAKLGAYEIIATIGAGGMGEVYRARDTKLKREVAIKVLPQVFAADSGRLARFQREAEVLASLNHPNIAHIYEVEDRALVMELVEGESPKGPMPFEEAWKMSLQIADALQYAHDKGVIHRDLKPANVKVTPEGVVKLLDFGLAKAFSGTQDGAGSDPSNSPTVTLGATVAGTIMGTAAYMSPEQARGKNVDKRADIWSWGVVLYELLTGERLFSGEDAAETLAAVIHKPPDLKGVPVQLRKLLESCLEKDPNKRLRDIGDARRLLVEESPASVAVLPQGRMAAWLAWSLGALFLLISAGLGVVAWKYFHPEPPQVVKFSFPPPGKATFPTLVPTLAVSPDGRRIAFEALDGEKRELWARELGELAPRMIAELDAGSSETPFWAPDSRRLAFFDGTKLRSIDFAGGPALTLADLGQEASFTSGSFFGSWNRDDVIIIGTGNTPVLRVPATGGSLSPVTELDKGRGETGHWQLNFLPDGQHFLYLAISTDPAKPARSAVYVGDLNSKARKQILNFGTFTAYVSPGYLLYVRNGGLMAQPFSTNKLAFTGDAVPVVEEIGARSDSGFDFAQFSASQTGVLVYETGGVGLNVQPTWFDRHGTITGTLGEPAYYQNLVMSRDGPRLAAAIGDGGVSDIWSLDLERGISTRLTSDRLSNSNPVWSPDGRRIEFSSLRSGHLDLFVKAADGTGKEELLLHSDQDKFVSDFGWSRDGRYLVYTSMDPHNKADLWILPMQGDKKPFLFLGTTFNESGANFSPDGRWISYVSDESGRNEIYVRPFRPPGAEPAAENAAQGQWRISKNGARSAWWRQDGKELILYNGGSFISAEVSTSPSFHAGLPQELFRAPSADAYTATPDFKRFLIVLPAGAGTNPQAMNVVLDWPQLLKK